MFSRGTEKRIRLVFWFLAVSLAACAPEAPEPSGSRVGEIDSRKAAAPTVDSAVYRGAALAGQVCSQCHDVATGDSSVRNANAPSFASVANRPGMTGAKLEQWLTSLHPSMPNYLFDAVTVKDLAAYVMSLRER
jgi:mono/diheme cytochrome c family protein